MSIINEALKKTQQTRKLDKDKRTQVKERILAEPAPAPSRAPARSRARLSNTYEQEKQSLIVQKLDLLFTKRTGAYFAGTLLLVILGVNSYQHAKYSNVPIVQAAISQAKEKLAFTGIMVSDEARAAVINMQAYHLGDTVKGMKILAINQDSIDLQRDDKVIQLRVGSTYMI